MTGGAAREQVDWLLCRAGAGLCALPLDQVVEIMRVLPTEPVAAPPPCTSGLSIIRGSPVPVLDLGCLLGEAKREPERFVTVKVAGRTVALAVEAVLGVRRIEAAELEALPPLLRDAARDAVAAIGALDAELLLLLRTGRLVPDSVFDRLDAEADQ
ncbi:MAG: chemotaxis protein CheW [Aliidongia sp.]